MSKLLDDRAVSSFGVSIGTGLMLESLFKTTTDRYDDARDIPVKIDPNQYKNHVYNVYTLCRNIISAASSKDREAIIEHKDFSNVLLDEIYTIFSLYESTDCVPVLHIPDYDKVYRNMSVGKEGNFKAYMEIKTLYHMLKNIKIDNHVSVIRKDHKFRITDKTLITTSYSFDLLNNTNRLELLESHTGKLKKRHDFNTKYHAVGRQDISMLPFNEKLLYVMGDKTFLKPTSIKDRLLLLELAKANKFTPNTTEDKVMFHIKKNDVLNTLLKQYINLY